MAVPFAAVYSLIVASRFGLPGLAGWAAVWSVVVFRATSKPRTRGANRTYRRGQSDA